MEGMTDLRVQKISDIISEYLNCINSIRDTFAENTIVLQDAEFRAKESFRVFISRNNLELKDLVEISPLQLKELKVIIRKIERTELSSIIFPQSMLVSLVAQYDNLVGQLIQFIYSVNPDSLNESGSLISYKELFTYSDISAIRNKIIQDRVETILRKSHEEQIDDLQRLSGVKNLKGVSFWKEFIEITQRRNLLVHCQGRVSEQYINKCKEAGVSNLPSTGDKLSVDEDYFYRAYFVFYTMGVMLSQVITRHLLERDKVLGEIDTILNNNIYEALEEEKYDLVIELSKFALATTTKHACRLDEVYFVLNYAQAYKWQGNQQKCNEILASFDFSAMTSDILVAKYALEDNVLMVVEHMKKTGDNSRIMTKEAYVSWVIFKEMREKDEFRDAYKRIFGEELTTELLTSEENRVVKELESISQD